MGKTCEKSMKEVNTLLATIAERVENVIKNQEDNHQENKEEHAKIIERQDHTNGNVTALQKWKAYLLGAGAVLYFMVSVILPLLGFYFIRTTKYEIMEEMKLSTQAMIRENNERQFETYIEE